MDRTRQAIFNVIGDRAAHARTLDLFAGGGSLGIEALSRGAVSCLFVERHPKVISFLRANLAGLPHATVARGDVRRVLPRLAGREFELVLMDPPYGQGLVETTLVLLCRHRLVATGGMVVVEHDSAERPAVPDEWEQVKSSRYGGSHVTVLWRTS